VTFRSFAAGAEAARAIAQAGLYPANCRLLDPGEAATAGAGSGAEAVLLVAFESADHAPDAWMARALECARDHGGEASPDAGRTRAAEAGAREGAAGAWRQSFLNAPYLRDALVTMGMISETFETAITWDRFAAFHAGVVEATETAVRAACGQGQVTCRFTHVYPDGPAPYYTIIAPGRSGAELEQWAAIKRAAADAVIRLGGTITHHHAVGRDHRPWYDRQRPDRFAAALAAAKATLDPAGVLNPGVLIDPR
jgi:alkyldihydroxyacetonephosphate synthase